MMADADNGKEIVYKGRLPKKKKRILGALPLTPRPPPPLDKLGALILVLFFLFFISYLGSRGFETHLI